MQTGAAVLSEAKRRKGVCRFAARGFDGLDRGSLSLH
jgi:hypothetical protein